MSSIRQSPPPTVAPFNARTGIKLDARTMAGAATNEINPVIRDRREVSMLSKYPVVYVEWIDHSAEGGWSHEDEEVSDNPVCGSVGWLFRETPDSIILISSLCENTKQVGNKQIISKKLIHATRILRKSRNRKQAAASAEVNVSAAVSDSGAGGGAVSRKS